MTATARLPLSLLAALWAALATASCATLSGAEPGPPAEEEPTLTLTLLHLNDVYQFTPVDHGRRGGLARVATLRKRTLADSPHVLTLFGGDTLSPSVESTLYKGKQMVDAWNALGLDYAVLGNHEFDLKADVLRQRMAESRFTWLGANVVDKRTGQLFANARPYVLHPVGGLKVGLLGLVLPETSTTTKAGPDIEFHEVCETARRLVPELRAQGAQAIVALTHLSLEEDKELARCAKVDLILGGHEHTLQQASSNGTPILKVTSDARELARVQVHLGTRTGKVQAIVWEILPVTEEVPEDAEYLAALGSYDTLIKELAEPVGATAVHLDADSVANRTRETNLGSFIADAYRRATGAHVALLNGGAIRADALLPPGLLTRRDVLAILPYKEPVVTIEVTGEVLRQALEHGVARSAEDIRPGRFPQVSGLRYTFDAERPPGQRVTSLTVQGQPLEPTRTYTLATTTFLTEGGDGYDMLKGRPLLVPVDKAPIAQEVLRQALAGPNPVAPRVDGRIVRCDGSECERPCQPPECTGPLKRKKRASRRSPDAASPWK